MCKHQNYVVQARIHDIVFCWCPECGAVTMGSDDDNGHPNPFSSEWTFPDKNMFKSKKKVTKKAKK